ncbi:MAG TPA: hypothetical protein VNX86_04825 [Rhizomicrobium sp.]|jgi:hypothetical protein|nr:hypothetical protein [Rhizomicrobium sp.]
MSGTGTSAAPSPIGQMWNNAGGIILGGINAGGPALVLELTALGKTLADKELDDFNTAVTVFDENLQSTGDWAASADKAFGSGSVFQAAAKSDALAVAIQAAIQLASFVQGFVTLAKSAISVL